MAIWDENWCIHQFNWMQNKLIENFSWLWYNLVKCILLRVKHSGNLIWYIFHLFTSHIIATLCQIYFNDYKNKHTCNMMIPDNKVHWANMGPIWGLQDPGGRHVGPMNFVIWDGFCSFCLTNGISSLLIHLNYLIQILQGGFIGIRTNHIT